MRDRERLAQDLQRESGDLGVVLGVEARLDQLEVPVAEVAVDEVVEPERRAVELERLDRARSVRLRALEPREDPRVLDGDRCGRGPPEMRSSGSMPVPSDLLIRRPSGAWMTECT